MYSWGEGAGVRGEASIDLAKSSIRTRSKPLIDTPFRAKRWRLDQLANRVNHLLGKRRKPRLIPLRAMNRDQPLLEIEILDAKP